MESRPVRLGWLSLLLTVVIICLAVFSVLSFATANADLTLAKKQAQQVQSVYVLERAGQQWAADVNSALMFASEHDNININLPAGTKQDGNSFHTVITGDDGRFLTISAEWNKGEFRLTEWKQSAEWAGETDSIALLGTQKDSKQGENG